MSQNNEHTNEHDSTWLLIPWYVNGRIGDQQRSDVDAHLRTCHACQHEVLAQRQLCKAMADSNPEIEQLPSASLRRLMQTIEAHQPTTRELPLHVEKATVITHLQRVKLMLCSTRWAESVAASVAVIAAAISGVLLLNHVELNSKAPSANYHTVTSPAARVPSEVIRAVFTPSITVAEMQTILNEAQLNIVAGPTPAGVYSLAKTGSRSVNESLMQLRNHPQVLFAEPSAPTDMVAAQ
jgi:anti-sigma factor RsiW